MDSLYDHESYSDSHGQNSSLSSSSDHLHRDRHQQHRQHLQRPSSRYVNQQKQPQQEDEHAMDDSDAYLYYTRQHELTSSPSRTRRHHHPSPQPQQQQQRSHRHHQEKTSLSDAQTSVDSSHGTDGPPDDVDDEGYFLSAVSGVPSIELADLAPHNRSSNPGDGVDAVDGASAEAGETTLVEEFAVPAWSQGSRLLERRIHQAVDHETTELDPTHTPWEVARSDTAGTHVAGRGGHWPSGPPPLAPSLRPLLDNTGAASATSPPVLLGPRMKEAEMPADPRNRLLDLVITNTAASVTLGEIEETMQWSQRYEPMYGPLLEYLQSYQSIFVVSPVDDRVRLRRLFSIRTAEEVARRRTQAAPLSSNPAGAAAAAAGSSRTARSRLSRRSGRDTAAAAHRSPSSAVDRRSGKPSLPSAEALAAHIGSVSYSCVGEHLRLEALELVYRRRGYDTAMMHGVLHVTNENDFHLFLFSSGAVVWWGMDRKDHWMVEDDFLAEATHIVDGVEHRYVQSEIEALFPIWCSFEVDEQCDDMQIASPLGIQPAAVEPALERLSKVLCFDHYLVPATEPARSLVMLTFSHSLGRSARVDYFEFVTKWSHRHILSIPAEFSGLLDYFSTKRRIAKLEGEIEVAQLAIQSIHDTPDVLWEVPWLQAYYDMVEQQNTAQSRLAWFASRSDTLLEQLSHIKARRHRLFMLGSDVFLIVILILDVMFMTSRLVAKMYFKVEEED